MGLVCKTGPLFGNANKNRSRALAGLLALTAAFATAACGASDVADESYESAPELGEEAAQHSVAQSSSEAVESQASALRDLNNDDGFGTCRLDCFDQCTSMGGSSSECSKSCRKACQAAGCNGNNWEACGAGSNSSSNPICRFMNSVWEKTCKASTPLKAFCAPFGGCSGCRRRMDENC